MLDTSDAWSKQRRDAALDPDNLKRLAAARDEYRALMSAHTATVLAGGDLSTLEPTC